MKCRHIGLVKRNWRLKCRSERLTNGSFKSRFFRKKLRKLRLRKINKREFVKTLSTDIHTYYTYRTLTACRRRIRLAIMSILRGLFNLGKDFSIKTDDDKNKFL